MNKLSYLELLSVLKAKYIWLNSKVNANPIVVGSVSVIVTLFFEAHLHIKVSETIENLYQSNRNVRILISIFLGIGFYSLVLGGWFLYLTLRRSRFESKISTLSEQVSTQKDELEKSDKLGLAYVLKNDSEENISENNLKIKSILTNTDPNTLDMILTTGYELISMDHKHEIETMRSKYQLPGIPNRIGVFHELLEKCKFPVRILLLHPESEFATKRGKAIITDHEHYRELIYRTIAYFNLIKKRNIELRYYDMEPVWNLIKNERLMFIQPVSETNKSRNNNWFGLSVTPGTLSQGYITLFNKKWNEKCDLLFDKSKLKIIEKEIKNKVKTIKK